MKTILTYLIELNISVSVLFLVYHILFRKDANFKSRRAFLLLIMGISIVIPMIHIGVNSPVKGFQSPVVSLGEVIISGDGHSVESSGYTLNYLIILAYLIPSIILLTKLIMSIFLIIRAAIKADRGLVYGRPVIFNRHLHASSFFSYVFIDPARSQDEEAEMILHHEACHARLYHSIDRILSEVLVAISWFNPFMWALRKALVVNHEYEADDGVLELGSNQVNYQLSILNQYLGSASVVNQFSSQIKNRIIMLNKNYKKGSFWKSGILLPVSLTLLIFMACENEATKKNVITDEPVPPEQEIFYVVEEMPQWPGSEDLTMSIRKFIAENLKYPQAAIANGATGKVFIQFIVTKTGDVIVPDPKLLPPPAVEEADKEIVVVAYQPLEPVDDLPDEKIIQAFKEESIRVIELMPDLIPGKQRGNPVNVIFTMPITFMLQ